MTNVRAWSFMLLWLFFAIVLTSAVLYLFANASEPSESDINFPSPPENFDFSNPLSWASLINFIGGVFSLLLTGFPNTGIPSPLNWILSSMFYIMIIALIVAWVRG